MSDSGPPFLGFVVITHGRVGESLLEVARYIMGDKLPRFTSVRVPFMGEMVELADQPAPFTDRRELIKHRLGEAMAQVDNGAGLLILTDIVGGTAHAVARELMAGRAGAVIAGVNLPMLLKAASIKGLSPEQAARELVERSRAAICRRD